MHALAALCFKTERCIPNCVEQVECYYDTTFLGTAFLDQDLHRFDLDEITRDKTHHFVFKRNTTEKYTS